MSESTKKARAVITSFLQKDPEVSLLQQPMGEAAAYESQSGGVKEPIEGLEQKLSDKRSDGQKGEANEKRTYDVMMMQLHAQLKESKYDREKKAAAKAQAEQAQEAGLQVSAPAGCCAERRRPSAACCSSGWPPAWRRTRSAR